MKPCAASKAPALGCTSPKPERRFNVVFWLAICAGITLAAVLLIGISAMAAEIPKHVPPAVMGLESVCKGGC